MYSNQDLDEAVKEGILSEDSVNKFKEFVEQNNKSLKADEENFKLIASFNDIFVVMACSLLLLSSAWISYKVDPAAAAFSVAVLSWGLAEFFVLKRKMAFPAIVLLNTFVGGTFTTVLLVLGNITSNPIILAALAATIAAWCHWRRFKVPITVAAGIVASLVFIISSLINFFPTLTNFLMPLMFIAGLLVFGIAMKWDSSDLHRITWKTDVAFWLHLTAAPLIVHPIFSNLGVLEGNKSLSSLSIIVLLYIIVSLISVTIDRRAFMVSSLVYVLIALTQLLKTYGFASDSFAYVGVFIGFSLLLLSRFWQIARRALVGFLPQRVQNIIPVMN